MSDLQCPAVVILTARERVAGERVERALAGRHVAGMFLVAAGSADAEAGDTAARCASSRGHALEILTGVVGGAGLRERVDALADLHRGGTIWVVAPAAMIAGALGRRDLEGEAGTVVVAIDSAGWTLRDR